MLARAFGRGGPPVPVIGQGTWNVPLRGGARDEALRALRAGIELGMTHVDTAEMYGDGGAEELVLTTAGAVSTLFAVNLTPAGTRGVPGTNIVTATAPPAGTAVKPKSTVTISSKAPAKKAAPKKKAPAGKAA